MTRDPLSKGSPYRPLLVLSAPKSLMLSFGPCPRFGLKRGYCTENMIVGTIIYRNKVHDSVFSFRQVYFVLKRKELGQPLSGPSRSNHKSYCDEMFLLPPLDPGCSVLVHNDGSCTLLHAARALQAILLLLPLLAWLCSHGA